MPNTIPFIAQTNRATQRRCGASALCMVLCSLGIEKTADEIWSILEQDLRREVKQDLGQNLEESWKRNRVAESDIRSKGLATFRLATFARSYGIDAVPVRFQKPWNFLKNLAVSPDLRLILNLRVRPASPLGHFAVFVDANSHVDRNDYVDRDSPLDRDSNCNATGIQTVAPTVRLHDPQKGPNQVYMEPELLELWRREPQPSEITGFVGVLFWNRGNPTVPTQSITCPKCQVSYPLPQHFVLRNDFKTVFCPECGGVENRG
ncbi:MAG: hypothetical protein ACRC10_08180 [Thermoguttaceae bacterium]